MVSFIAGQCDLDAELTTRDGNPAIAWSWLGWNENDEANVRGWAVLEDPKTPKGRVYGHRGDASDFRAVRLSA